MPERQPQAVDSPPVPKVDSLKGLKRESILSTAKSLYERLSPQPESDFLKTDQQDRQDVDYLKRLVKVGRYGRLGLKGHHSVVVTGPYADPDKLWVATNILYPKAEAEEAYYIIQAAQIASMGGTVGEMDARRIHQELLKPESQSVLTGLNSRQIIYGENATLKLLNEQLNPQITIERGFKPGDPMPEVDKAFQERIADNQETLDYYLRNLREESTPPSGHHVELSRTIMGAGISPASSKFQELASTYEEKGFDDMRRAMGEIARAFKEGKLVPYPESYVAWMTAQWQPFLALVHKFQGVGSDNPVSEALEEYRLMVGYGSGSIIGRFPEEKTDEAIIRFPSNLIEANAKAVKVFIKNLRDPKRFHPDPSNPGDLIDDRNLRMTGSLETGWFQQARVAITAGERYGLPMIMFIPGGHAMLVLSSLHSSFVEENGRIVEKLKVSVYNPSKAGVEEIDVSPDQPGQLSPFYTNFLTDAAFQDGSYNIHYWNDPALKEYREALLNGKLAVLQQDGWNCVPFCLFVNAILHALAPGESYFKGWGRERFYDDFGVRIRTREELIPNSQ